MIIVTGDTHGEQGRFNYLATQGETEWTENDYLIVSGDFGYLFLNDSYENVFLNHLEEKPYTICFVDGNHENHAGPGGLERILPPLRGPHRRRMAGNDPHLRKEGSRGTQVIRQNTFIEGADFSAPFFFSGTPPPEAGDQKTAGAEYKSPATPVPPNKECNPAPSPDPMPDRWGDALDWQSANRTSGTVPQPPLPREKY